MFRLCQPAKLIHTMNFRRILLTLLTGAAITTATFAQSARQILDRTSSKLKSSGGIEANFEATRFNGIQEAETANGQISLSGNKFKITSSSLTTWFDGRTQWTLMHGSDEVNVSTPTAAELQQINPYTFLSLYKKDYNLTTTNTTYHNKPAFEVRMHAQSAASTLSLIIITIDKATDMPLSVRIKDKKGVWMRIRVSNIQTGKRFNESTFKFDTTQHPGIEVIDLR